MMMTEQEQFVPDDQMFMRLAFFEDLANFDGTILDATGRRKIFLSGK